MKIWPPSVIIGVIHKSSETMSTIVHMSHIPGWKIDKILKIVV